MRKNYPNLWSKKTNKPTRAFIGCPHNSFHQLYDWGMKVTHALSNRGLQKVAFPTHLFCSPPVRKHFEDEYPELVRDMKRAGLTFTNICPLMFAGLKDFNNTEFCVTNSNKARMYTTSRYFEDDTLLEILLTGEVPDEA